MEDVLTAVKECGQLVFDFLKFGYTESVYQNALYLELQKRGYCVQKSYYIEIEYQGDIVGYGVADLMLTLSTNNSALSYDHHRLVIELKTGRAANLAKTALVQAESYARALNRRAIKGHVSSLAVAFCPGGPEWAFAG